MDDWKTEQYLTTIINRIESLQTQVWGLSRAIEACLEPQKSLIRYLVAEMKEEIKGGTGD